MCAENEKLFVETLSLCTPVSRHLQSWFKHSTAIIIGINRYKHAVSLNYCVADAKLMERCLLERGFDVTLLLDAEATKHNITKHVLDKVSKLEQSGRLIIFFAGHGDAKTGAILPFDFNPDCIYATSIPMKNFGLSGFFKTIAPHHCLVVLDCCFSGKAFSKRSCTDVHVLENHLSYRTAEILTAGRSDQSVLEKDGNGVFTRALAQGLDGGAYGDSDLWITSSTLLSYVTAKVSGANQTPQYQRIEGEGEFIFERTHKTLPSFARRD